MGDDATKSMNICMIGIRPHRIEPTMTAATGMRIP